MSQSNNQDTPDADDACADDKILNMSWCPTRLVNYDRQLRNEPPIFPDHDVALPFNYQVKRHDVICWPKGVRAQDTGWNAGNERFKIVISIHAQRYQRAATKKEKIAICKSAVDWVRQAGGNFVRYVEDEDPMTTKTTKAAVAVTAIALSTPGTAAPATKTSSSSSLRGRRQAHSYTTIGGVSGGSGQWTDIGNLKAREKASHALRAELKRLRSVREGSTQNETPTKIAKVNKRKSAPTTTAPTMAVANKKRKSVPSTMATTIPTTTTTLLAPEPATSQPLRFRRPPRLLSIVSASSTSTSGKCGSGGSGSYDSESCQGDESSSHDDDDMDVLADCWTALLPSEAAMTRSVVSHGLDDGGDVHKFGAAAATQDDDITSITGSDNDDDDWNGRDVLGLDEDIAHIWGDN